MSIIIGYIALIGFVKLIIPNKSFNKKLFVVLAGLLLLLISSLRSVRFTPDTSGYVFRYLTLSFNRLSELWTNVITNTGKDPFFYFFAKIINMITGANYRIWLATIAGLFCFAVLKLIYNYSNEPFISYVALISLGYFYFSLTGLRQTMALSFVILSYKYLRERKLLPFVVLVIIGSLFHSSALIFLIAYPLANKKLGLKKIISVIIAMILANLFSDNIINFLDVILKQERFDNFFSNPDTLNLSGFIIQLIILLFCLYLKNNVLNSDVANLSLYNLLYLGLVFQSFSVVIAEFFRISMYFSVFGIVLIPNTILSIKDSRNRAIVYILVLCALIAYIFWTGSFSDFRFYWE